MKPSKLKRLAEEGMLDDETFTRIRHLGRFFERVGRAALKPKLKVGEVFSEEELQAIWRETAEDDNAGIGETLGSFLTRARVH